MTSPRAEFAAWAKPEKVLAKKHKWYLMARDANHDKAVCSVCLMTRIRTNPRNGFQMVKYRDVDGVESRGRVSACQGSSYAVAR